MTVRAAAHGDPGIFSQRLSDADFTGKPCLFLDRDGVLIEETHYLHRTDDVALIGGVAEAIRKANGASVAVVMVTNQAGIGRGYYGWQEFDLVQQHVLGACSSLGAHCDMILACAYHRDGVSPFNVDGHSWRKPEPGMLLEAARVLGIDLSRSYIVGDTLADLMAGAKAGLSGGALVLTGHGEREWKENGLAAFALHAGSGSFCPRLAPNGAEAIEHWLAELGA